MKGNKKNYLFLLRAIPLKSIGGTGKYSLKKYEICWGGGGLRKYNTYLGVCVQNHASQYIQVCVW